MIRSDYSAADATTLVPGMFFSPGILFSGLKGPKKSDMIKWCEEMSVVLTSTLYRIALVQLIPLISSERFMKEDQENRNYLGVFTIVKFSNDACQGGSQHIPATFEWSVILGSASNSVGQCLAYADCYMSGGYGDGSCAEVRTLDSSEGVIWVSPGFWSLLPLLHQLMRLHHQPEHHLSPEPRLPLRLLHCCFDTMRIQDYKGGDQGFTYIHF